jgi:Flp pilus assembly protein CpaB
VKVTSARPEGSTPPPACATQGIPEGYEAVTLNLSAPQAGGGVVQRGDHITIYASFSDVSVIRGSSLADFFAGKAEADNQTQDLGDFTVTVVPDVTVLRVIQETIASTNTDSTIALTLALTPEDASHVIFSQQNGSVWMALLPPGQDGENVAPVGLLDVISIEGIR